MIFPKNARVCFIGDSITAANKALSRIVDAYKSQFPEQKVIFFNCGTAGAQLFYPLTHFDDDIAFFNPTHAVISFGINDAWLWNIPYLPSEKHYNLLLEAYENYKQRLYALCERLESIGVQGIPLCTPPPYNEFSASDTLLWPGAAAAMVGYSAFIREFAKEKGYLICDYNSFLTKAMQTDNMVFTDSDRIHPSEHGYYLMAKCFLLSQGIDIGEEKDIPEYLDSWRKKVDDLRDIHYVENNIIENKEISQEEKFNFLQQFLKRDDIPQDFVTRGNKYFFNQPKASQIAKEIEEIYNKDILEK